VDDTPILDAPWPDDLDPSDVQFRRRSISVLRRMGYPDDPTQFDTLIEAVVLSWTNAGPETVADIRTVAVRVPGSGRVGLTEARVWHAGVERGGGLLPDTKGPGTGPTPCVSLSVRSTSS
jgi:hypothetical protein